MIYHSQFQAAVQIWREVMGEEIRGNVGMREGEGGGDGRGGNPATKMFMLVKTKLRLKQLEVYLFLIFDSIMRIMILTLKKKLPP